MKRTGLLRGLASADASQGRVTGPRLGSDPLRPPHDLSPPSSSSPMSSRLLSLPTSLLLAPIYECYGGLPSLVAGSLSWIERRSTAPDEKTRGVALSGPALRSRADAGPRSQGAAGRVGRDEVSDAAPLAPRGHGRKHRSVTSSSPEAETGAGVQRSAAPTRLGTNTQRGT